MTRWWFSALAFIPAGVGLLIAGAMQVGMIPSSLLFVSVRTDAGMAAAVAGIVLSGMVLIFVGLHHRRKLTDLETRDIERTTVELPAVVEEAVELAHSIPGHSDRQIAVSIPRVPWQPGPVRGDADLLVLALYNLLDNALKFSPAGALVEVRAIDDGVAALVEIANTGAGIRAEDLPHLTEELFRGRDTQGIEGSGLGLALVDRIVQLHGGELAIRSREGQGTVASIRLRLARG